MLLHALVYIAAFSGPLYNKNLGFRQWRLLTDRVLTLDMNIRFPLFGALGEGPGARTLPYVRVWHMGVIIGKV